ncbi:hypothetical protein [Campylobacter geochelonis]|uniref:hypothetical protein n=1 Tax=Campylobacter geochelonis TaxID=1780362 RepID=UPI000770AA41|nr:hypothetical protein [Campylobacter geochelonis]CZE49393.1 ferrochelatase [Campylobacter geochelonis]
MTIQNLVRLIGAKLLNEPSISNVDSFTFNLKDIRHATAFIAINASEEDVEEAINLGAYAVIFDSEFEVKNKEVAYIKVQNLNSALFKLMRFTLALNSVKFVRLSTIESAILSKCSVDKKAIFASENAHELFMQVMNAKQDEIFFSPNLETIEKITSVYESISPNLEVKPDIDGSIFYLNFIYEDGYFKLNFPQIFLPEIYGILDYMRENDIEIKFKDGRNLGHFEPIFVDRFYDVRHFGDSYRAFIVESDERLFLREAKFLKNKFKGEIITFSPFSNDIESDIKYRNLSDLKVNYNFRYALVLGNHNEILAMLNQKAEEATLFDEIEE